MIREMGELTPAVLWSPKVHYRYSVNSSNTSLTTWYWNSPSPIVYWPESMGGKSSFLAIWSHGAHWLMHAPSPANSQCEDRFTERSFHEHLVNFIVADDQVCNCQSPVHSIALYLKKQFTIVLRTYSLFVRFLLQCFQVCVHKTTYNDL